MTDPVEAVIARIRAVYGGWGRSTSVETMRRDWDALFAGDRPPHAFEPTDGFGAPAAWVAAPGTDPTRAILYLHGGGFRLGSIASHRGLMARLSAEVGCRVLGLDYRLAPEHRFPAAFDDAQAALDRLESAVGDMGRVALAGDSAGGGLVLSLLLSRRDAGRRLPAAAYVISPWTDLAATGETYVTRADADPIHQRPMILAMARGYLGPDGDPRDPRASPLHADLSGLPPLLIQVGDRETVLDDSRIFAAKASAAGADVRLDVADGMIHVFPMFADDLVEGRRALAEAGTFLRRHLRPEPSREPVRP